MPKIERSDVLERQGLEEKKYFIVSAHREENVDSPEVLKDLLDTLEALAQKYDFPVLVSTHPRTRKRLEAMDSRELDPRITFAKPFGFVDYIKLQMSAFCVLSDSGTITEEASLLGLPALTIRNAHERPEGMDVGTLIMSGLRKDRVLDSVEIVTTQLSERPANTRPVAEYENPSVSQQVLRVVMSYTDYVNRTVWRKSL
jgi:UDP-N-acetylglucosamine 2-epimerase